jgi:hypothetical protein
MCRRSNGSARSRSTPEGADRRRTGCGRTSSIVLLPEFGVAVRDGAVCGAAIVVKCDMLLGYGVYLGGKSKLGYGK